MKHLPDRAEIFTRRADGQTFARLTVAGVAHEWYRGVWYGWAFIEGDFAGRLEDWYQEQKTKSAPANR